MFLGSRNAETMHRPAQMLLEQLEGCQPCNLSVRATWESFYTKRSITVVQRNIPGSSRTALGLKFIQKIIGQCPCGWWSCWGCVVGDPYITLSLFMFLFTVTFDFAQWKLIWNLIDGVLGTFLLVASFVAIHISCVWHLIVPCVSCWESCIIYRCGE